MDYATFSRFKRKERKKKEKKTKERHLYLILSAGNIAGTLIICLSARIKTLLYFRCRLVSKVIHCVVCLSNCLLLHVPFHFHFRLNLFSPLKTLHGKLKLSTKINNNISKPRGPYLPLSKGQEDEVVWWVCVTWNLETPWQRRSV